MKKSDTETSVDITNITDLLLVFGNDYYNSFCDSLSITKSELKNVFGGSVKFGDEYERGQYVTGTFTLTNNTLTLKPHGDGWYCAAYGK